MFSKRIHICIRIFFSAFLLIIILIFYPHYLLFRTRSFTQKCITMQVRSMIFKFSFSFTSIHVEIDTNSVARWGLFSHTLHWLLMIFWDCYCFCYVVVFWFFMLHFCTFTIVFVLKSSRSYCQISFLYPNICVKICCLYFSIEFIKRCFIAVFRICILYRMQPICL